MRGVALITGAARRIGRALALAAADAGYDVAVHHRGPSDTADALASEIRALGRNSQAVSAELTDDAQTSALVGLAYAALGPVTLLINNASVFLDDRIGTLTRESWDAHMKTNLWAPVRLAQAFAAELPAGAEGQIINVLDQRVWKSNPQFFSYGLSRSALWAPAPGPGCGWPPTAPSGSGRS